MYARRKLRMAFSLLIIAFLLTCAFLGSPTAHANTPPVNPNATQGARDLLNYLYGISGNQIIAGQHNYTEDPDYWSDQAEGITGKQPGLWGCDFAWEDFASYRQGIVDEAIEQWQNGSIVTLSWHQQRPNDPDDAGWESVQGWYTEEEMAQLVTPGTTLYNQWLAKADLIAGYLKQLQNAGVPILWRPYHENNATWFWWGGRPALLKQLWMNMYDRYTNYHHLDNLIWVWSAASHNSWSLPLADFYPGDAYADVVGQDIYDGFQQGYYDELLAIAQNKPMAITESGKVPDSATFVNQPRYAFFLIWGSHLTSENTNEAIQATYNDPFVLTQDEINIGTDPDPGTLTVDDSVTGTGQSQFNFVGDWSTSTGAGKYNGGDHYSATTDAYVEVAFNGTQIKLYGSKDAHHGIAAVSIDGGAETQVDYYAPTRNDNTLIWTSPELSPGNHTLKVRVTGTKNASATWTVITADRVDITGSSATTVDDSVTGTGQNQFNFVGSWSTSTGSSKYNGGDHYSPTANDYVQVAFNGRQIKLYASKDIHHGIAAISIDGGAETAVDYYAPARSDNALIWTSPQLSPGNHTLKVRVTGNKNPSSAWTVVTIDRVDILP